jgi:multiple sugar transport system ATP-binding protein
VLEPYAGKPIIFGVRPESLYEKAPDEAGGQTASLKATVEVVEPMGNEVYVYVTTGKHPIAARLMTRREIRPGSEINLFIDMRRVHFFNPGDEKTLV